MLNVYTNALHLPILLNRLYAGAIQQAASKAISGDNAYSSAATSATVKTKGMLWRVQVLHAIEP